ncbi:hypothetical protein Tco_0333491 [Tanacetum coccineum]
MKDKVSQEQVCEEEVPLNNNIGKQIVDFVDMPSEAVKQGMDANVLDEIDGAKGEQVPNLVVKKDNLEFLVCKEVANPGVNELVDKERPLKRKKVEELENKLTSREELAVLQVEFADMEGQMQQLMKELKKSQKNVFFWKSTAIVFGVLASFMPPNFPKNIQALLLSHAYNLHLQSTASASFSWEVHWLAELPFASE